MFYFGFIGNENMYSLTLLFIELFFIGAAILYIISEIFIVIF